MVSSSPGQGPQKTLKSAIACLLKNELWVAGGFVLLSMAIPAWINLALVVLLLFWPLRKLESGRFTQPTPVDWPIFFLSVMGLVSMVISPIPDKTNIQVARLWSGIALLYAVVNWTKTISRLQWMVQGVTLVTLLLALAAPFSVEWSLSKLPFIPSTLYQSFQVAFADTIHPNVLAGTLIYFLPIPLAMLLYHWRGLSVSQRAFALVAVVVAISMLLLTKTRAAWLALGCVLLVMTIWRWRWGWLSVPISLLALMFLIWQVSPQELLNMIVSSGSIKGMPERIQIWERASRMILDFPLSGIGMGTFQETTHTLYPFLGTSSIPYEHAHNLFLQIGVDLGIPGLVAWLLLVGILLKNAWNMVRLTKKEAGSFWLALGFGFIGSQMAMLLHGLLDAVTWGMVRSAPFVWAIWGVYLSGWLLFNQELGRRK